MSLGSSTANQRVEIYDNDNELKATIKQAGSDTALVVTSAGSVANYPSTTYAEWGATSITDTAVEIFPQDTDRISFKVTTSGTESVYLGFGNTVSPLNGFPLDQGDVFEQTTGDLYQGSVWLICDTGKTSEVRWVIYTQP
jgi:hypothetical protein